MPVSIPNASSAFGQTTGQEGAPYLAVPMKNSHASATIAKNTLVSFDTQTTDIVPTVQTSATSADGSLVAGVALEDIPAGKVGKVVILGYAVVKYTGTAPTAGYTGVASGATAGSAVFANGAATDVVGDVHLRALGGQIGSTGTAAVWVFP